MPEISMWSLYILNVMFNIFQLAIVTTIISGAYSLMYVVSSYLDEDVCNALRPNIKKVFCVLILSITLLLLIPTKKEALAIYIIPKIVNNESIQQMPGTALKSMEYLNLIFEKELKELRMNSNE